MSAMVQVRAAVAPLNAEPRLSSEQVSQTLAGHRLTVLEDRTPWLRVRAHDGYEGWLHRGYTSAASVGVGAMDPEPTTIARDAMSLAPVLPTDDGRRISLGCIVCERDGRRRRLPVGALLADDDHVDDGTALTSREMHVRFPRTPETIVRTALELFEGTPYEWGGITPWGADCSGFVQTCFGLHGIALPRDARQQAEMGEDAGSSLDSLAPSDLLFFSERDDGRITHVAIVVGPLQLVHLALGRGGYAVERLDAEADRYVADLMRRLRSVRRII